MRQTRDEIAEELYGCEYLDLNPGEKAAVTRAFNAQSTSTTRVRETVSSSGSAVRAEFGRVGYNGTKVVLVPNGTTIQQALTQAGIVLDTSKEGVQLMTDDSVSTVRLNDIVVHNGIYVVTPEVRSA
jgi:catalase (peroxidase I)